MDNKRTQTLEALSTFIETHRALLARTQSDIERLKALKRQPAEFLRQLESPDTSSTFKLSDQPVLDTELPRTIEWSLYATHDPTPLKTLATQSRAVNEPAPYQRSELSDLQKLVKESRRHIVDPLLARIEALPQEDESEEEDEEDENKTKISATEEAKREREQAKIRALKKRKMMSCGGLTIPLSGFGYRRARGPSGVFVRRDLDDESGEVDISLDGPAQEGSRMETDGDTTVITPASTRSRSPASVIAYPPIALTKAIRTRRPSTKLVDQLQSQPQPQERSVSPPSNKRKRVSKKTTPQPRSPKPKAKQTNTKPKKEMVDIPNVVSKPKPETYKLAWSISEQHLLERLLEEIPDGERNRWQKISKAMDGKRTPRQVASRVQKYFEKLKRFGVEGEGI